jgi:signal transduction histidine kinase
MISTGPAQPASLLAGWARWVALAVFVVLDGIAFAPLRPGVVLACVGAVAAVGAAFLLLWRRGPLLLWAAVAAAGIVVLSYNRSSDVGWFALCLVGAWCGFAGQRGDALAFLIGALAVFTVELAWADPDPGWGPWIAGILLSVLLGLLVQRQTALVGQLREAQQQLAERARSEERNRIGRELHDVIAHTLTVALLHVTSARLAAEHDPADAARSLAEAERLTRESLDEVRLAVGTLHSGSTTAPLPGVDGLSALVERFRVAGADVSLCVDGETGRLHAATGLTVYRIAQEALTNAVKHAPGCSTLVNLTVGASSVRLTVDSASEPGTGSGLGLTSMRERAESVGGRCSAGPGGRGWLVDAVLPLTVGISLEGAA